MRRSEVWWVDFGSSIAGEIRKRRPAVIISNDAANRYLNRVQVVPLTSRLERVYPSEAVVRLGGGRSKALADQLTTVSKLRLINRIAKLTAADMAHVEQAVMVQLALANIAS